MLAHWDRTEAAALWSLAVAPFETRQVPCLALGGSQLLRQLTASWPQAVLASCPLDSGEIWMLVVQIALLSHAVTLFFPAQEVFVCIFLILFVGFSVLYRVYTARLPSRSIMNYYDFANRIKMKRTCNMKVATWKDVGMRLCQLCVDVPAMTIVASRSRTTFGTHPNHGEFSYDSWGVDVDVQAAGGCLVSFSHSIAAVSKG